MYLLTCINVCSPPLVYRWSDEFADSWMLFAGDICWWTVFIPTQDLVVKHRRGGGQFLQFRGSEDSRNSNGNR